VTTDDLSPGNRFRVAAEAESPLQIVGAVNAMCAKLAERAGFGALYLSGAGVANASYGLPDLGMTMLDHVLIDASRVASATDLPLLVDIDTGWETTATITTTIQRMIDAGVAAVHIEDQLEPKRCGHRPGKRLVDTDQMNDRIREAVSAKTDPNFVIMARTDAAADEGLEAAIQRANCYVDAGADMIFAEALTEADHFRQFTSSVSVPILANMTEFGRSPLLSVDELRELGIRLILYPLTAFRSMNAAAELTYNTLRENGIQSGVVDRMQTREQLYDVLDYHKFEQQIDAMADRSASQS
jgi:methylisocitrate lyase